MNLEDVEALFARLDPKIWLLTAQHGPRNGLIATCVMPASISAPRILVCLSKLHYTTELVRASGAFGLHLLAEEQLSWVWRLGLETGRERPKLVGLPSRQGQTGSPILADVAGWVECRVETEMDVGDRFIILGEVVDGATDPAREPLTMEKVIQNSPPDKLEQLREARQRDAASDAAAIMAWRENKAAKQQARVPKARG